MKTATVTFTSYNTSVANALNRINAAEKLAEQKAVLLKPNLVNSAPPPVTTPVSFCEAVAAYVQACSQASIIIAEGCGDKDYETNEIFTSLGYTSMAKRLGIPLVDLNTEPLKKLSCGTCSVFPEIYLPEVAFSHFIVSLPVLKAHSLAGITGSLKNMMGFAPPAHYSGMSGVWKKAAFHQHMHQAIRELNAYRTPDLTVMDATAGLAEHHLGGRLCSPPVQKIIAGYSPLEVDRKAAELLEFNWRDIPHLTEKC